MYSSVEKERIAGTRKTKIKSLTTQFPPRLQQEELHENHNE